MWRKSAAIFSRKLSRNTQLRLLSNLLSTPSDSYLCNPGLKPLSDISLGEALALAVNRHPDRVAIRSVHEDLTITYDQLLTQADALACALRGKGLDRGDRLGIWSHNSAAWVVALIAAARAGLISVLLNPVYEKSELSFCFKKMEIKGLVIGDDLPRRKYYGTLAYLIPQLQESKPGSVSSDLFPFLKTIITAGSKANPGTFSSNALVTDCARQDASKYSKEVKPEDGCLILLTSGTTGDPKAALNSHLGVVNNTYFIGKRNLFHEGHQNICVQAPFFHALGTVVTLLAGLQHGATLTIAAPTYNVDANIKALYAEKCTAVTGTPTMYVDILSQVKDRGPPPDLRVALAAGAPCSPQLIRDMQKHLNVQSVKGLYGLSETTAAVFQSNPGDDVESVAESVGYLHDHVEVKVVDENGQIVPFGVGGELMCRGYNNMMYYWDEPNKTREVLSEDGWLSTGDKFTISPDGYGRVVGRLKDIIVRGGENIAPKEVEDLLNTHPDILDSQVVGVADERLGEELCAVIRVRAGAKVTLSGVTQHLAGKLARFKIPRLLKQIDDFPKTNSGKIQKFKLTQMIEAGKL